MAEAVGSSDEARHVRPVQWREIFAGSLGRVALGLFLLEVLTAVQILHRQQRHGYGDRELASVTQVAGRRDPPGNRGAQSL